MSKKKQVHFVTGRLAEHFLRDTLTKIADSADFDFTIQVMPITVAALMTPAWIAKRLKTPNGTDEIVLPGYCDGDLLPITSMTDVSVIVGPRDLRQLPKFLGQERYVTDLSQSSIEIIAEINHAPRLNLDEIISQAKSLSESGADLIDVGCEPNGNWTGVADCVRALKDLGLRVSIDSLNPTEISAAVNAGAELVLSVNATNREAAPDWGCEVVVIPDDIRDIDSMNDTIELLSSKSVPLRLDPILEPIGLGFANSLERYIQTRRRWPDAEIMMGIGNLTELSDVDSAGVNFLLLGVCEELGIRSVLTTQVINWARSSVEECEIARRLVRFAVDNNVPPKNLSTDLVALRDSRLLDFDDTQLDALAEQIKDNNYRIFADQQMVHLLGAKMHLQDADPFELFEQLQATDPSNLSPSHSFYLGYEMCKAITAITLGKQYTQDESLDWGHLTKSERNRHRLSFAKKDK